MLFLLTAYLVVLLLSFASALPNLATSILLTDSIKTHGAGALDGTPPHYWFQKSSSNNQKFVIDLMGGGWCFSLEDCADRAYGERCWLGSSKTECLAREAPGNGYPGVGFNETMDFADIPSCLNSRWCGGLMNNDPVTNPVTHDWNKVLINYLDGGSYAGNRDEPVMTTYKGKQVPLYFRGIRNLRAIFDDLISNHGLGAAADVILTGDSAGGLAVFWHADFIKSFLNHRTNFIAVPDSGFFWADQKFWFDEISWSLKAQNSLGGLNSLCVETLTKKGDDPHKCGLPDVVSPFIQSRLFVVGSRFDPAVDYYCSHESGSNATNVNRIGAEMVRLISENVLHKPQNGAFLTSCHVHAGQWGQGQKGQFADFNVTIDGFQTIPALTEWLKGGRKLWVQPESYPCPSCCNSYKK